MRAGLKKYPCLSHVHVRVEVNNHSDAEAEAENLGPYKILPIFYCNKGGRGENILRNIVGKKGGLGGGHCTIMCNNAPFSVSRTIFIQTLPPATHPIKIRPLT